MRTLKPWSIALGYVALSLVALGLFALPLSYGWRVNVGTLRVFVPADMYALQDLFHREGPDAVAAAVRARSDPTGREVLVFAGPGKNVIAGTMRRWPTEIPDAPGTYGHVIDLGGDEPVRIVASHVFLPGGYQLLMGRHSAGLMSLEAQFWYGIAAAITIVLGLGAALAWQLARRANAARAAEERYARALQATNEGVWEWTPATDELFLSNRARRLWSVHEDAECRTRADLKRLGGFHPEDYAAAEEAILPSGEPGVEGFEAEYRVIDPDGAVRWVRSRGKMFAEANGERARVTGSLVDITERKRAEDALRASEERYALAVAGSDEGIFDADFVTGRVFFSARARELTGLPPGAETTTIEEYHNGLPIHPDDAARRSAALQAHLTGSAPAYEGEFRLRQRDGIYRWRRIHALCVRDADGRPCRMAGSISDVDARRRAEEALQQSEERYALAVAGSDDGVWDLDFTHQRVFISERARELAGMPTGPATVPMQQWLESLPLHPEDVPRRTEAFAAHLAGKTPAYVGEFRLRQPDGSYRWRRLRGLCVRDAQGRPYRMAGSISDVDARRVAADQLSASEARFRALTELWSDWYWEQDENLRYTFSSADVSPPDGYPGGIAVGKTRWELPGIVPLSSSWADHQALLAARKPFRDFEHSRPAADGTLRYITTSGVPIFDDQGNFKGYQGTARNITERKRVENALRLSEARYARAMDASADGLWEWNAATDELFISPRARILWGIPDGLEIRTREELKAHSLQFTEDTIRESIERPGVEMTYSVLDQGGELRWVRSVSKALLNERDEPMLVTGSLTDITERKLAVDALRLSEEELRERQEMLDLAQHAASAVAFEWHVGNGQGENRWSVDLEVMYGLLPGSYDGSFEAWKKLVFAEDWPTVREAIKRAHETGDVGAEYRVIHPGGAVRWLQVKGRMFFDDERKPTRVVGIMLDVTDRHQAEEELRRLERQLRQAQRLEAMGTLAGGIAHDFNNILGAILGYGEMAMRDVTKGSRLARDLESIIVAGERGRALVDRVLAFSRSGVGERVPVQVEKVVREALDLISAKLPSSVVLHTHLRAECAAMMGDATQVHQVVMNLVTNAIHAMPAGGDLSVSLCATTIESARVPTVGLVEAGDYLVLEVADNGTGMPRDVLERIFDPYFTTKEVGTGTGLGLSLVHGIVVELGGAIDVVSTPGEGSTFTVYLPRSGNEAAEGPRHEAPQLPRGDGRCVLVVDDEEPLVLLATRTLEELGYVAEGFTSSSAALAAFCADPQRFDALVTDERMPGMSGSALIREVRRVRGSMPVVLMSGYLGATAASVRESGMEGSVRAPLTHGANWADEIMQKPLSARDLAASLARVLRL